VAGAAAAGLVVGVVTGRTVRDIPSLHVSMHVGPPAASYSLSARAARDSADNELLREIERAVLSSGPNALRPIEDVTPVAWATE
jgi:hypothetical protein